MRQQGHVTTAAGLGLHGHACWIYDDDADYRTAAAAFLADGVRLGQRLMHVGDGTLEQLRDDLRFLADRDALEAGGRLQMLPLASIYPVGARTDATAMLDTYSTATQRALADGFTGLRVVAEVTPLVKDPANWSHHVRWECVAEGYMAGHPLSALCCYDGRVLPEAIVAELACAHPATSADSVLAPFGIAARDGGKVLALSGEIDCFSAGALHRVLDAALAAGGSLTVDLADVRFMDHNGLLSLHDAVRSGPADVSIENVPLMVRRTAELLEVTL